MKFIHTEKTYIRIFLVVVALFTAVTIIFAAVLSVQFSDYCVSQMNDFYEEQVRQSASSIELLLERFKLLSLNIYSDYDINLWLYDKADDKLLSQSVLLALLKHQRTEPYINDIYVINNKTERVMNASLGMRSFSKLDIRPMQDLIKRQEAQPFIFWDFQNGGKECLAFVMPYESGNGYLVVLFDKEKIQTNMIFQNRNENLEIAVLDERDSVVFGDGDGRPGDEAGDSIVTSAAILPENWRIYYIVSLTALRDQVGTLLASMIVTIVGLLLIIAVVLFQKLRSSFAPFGKLARSIHSILPGEEAEAKGLPAARTEYDLIQSGVDFLMESVEKLNVSMFNYKTIIQESLINQWVLDGNLSESTREYLGRHNLPLSYGHIRLAVLRICRYLSFVEKYDYYSRKALKFGIANISEELLASGGFESVCSDLGGDHIVVIIGCDGQSADEIVGILDDIRSKTELYMNLRLGVAISGRLGVESNIHGQYTKAYDMSNLIFLRNENHVYSERDMEDYTRMTEGYRDDKFVGELREHVYLGKEELIDERLRELGKRMRSLPYVECRYRLLFYSYQILCCFVDYTSLQSLEEVSATLDGFTTLSEAIQWLRAELGGIMQRMKSPALAIRKEDTVLQIKEYIAKNISNSALAIEDIAGNLSLSAGYTRLIFKEVCDESISDYLRNQRVLFAKNLIETTDWTLHSIMQNSGFVSKSHFFTSFKRVIGMTPNQYRMTPRREAGAR